MTAVLILFFPALILARLIPPPAGAERGLEWATLNVALPALILSRLPSIRLSTAAFVPGIVAWTMLALSAGLVLGAARWFGWDKATTGALLLVVPVGNTSFFGLPAIRAIAGEQAVPTIVLYDQLGTSLAVATYCAVIVAVYAGTQRPSVGETLRKVCTFPPLVSIVAALTIAGVSMVRGSTFAWPAAVGEPLELAGTAVSAVALWAVAVRASRLHWRTPDGPLLAGLALKLAIVPALLVGIVVGVRVDRTFELNVSLLETAMPSGIAASILAANVNLAADLATRMAVSGILLAFVTVPLWGQVLGF